MIAELIGFVYDRIRGVRPLRNAPKDVRIKAKAYMYGAGAGLHGHKGDGKVHIIDRSKDENDTVQGSEGSG